MPKKSPRIVTGCSATRSAMGPATRSSAATIPAPSGRITRQCTCAKCARARAPLSGPSTSTRSAEMRWDAESMSWAYTPTTRATVPPETPGIVSTTPMRPPRTTLPSSEVGRCSQAGEAGPEGEARREETGVGVDEASAVAMAAGFSRDLEWSRRRIGAGPHGTRRMLLVGHPGTGRDRSRTRPAAAGFAH